jgi:hypothetical protein
MLVRRITLALASACVLLYASPSSASDPHGYAAISLEWVEEPGVALGVDERVLRVVVKSAVEIKSVQLGYESPEYISVSLRGRDPAPTDADGIQRLRLGDLERDQSKAVEFVVRAPPTKEGVAVFTVSGDLAPGRGFEEKVGWTVGTPTAPTVRNGAAEYPARIEPE